MQRVSLLALWERGVGPQLTPALSAPTGSGEGSATVRRMLAGRRNGPASGPCSRGPLPLKATRVECAGLGRPTWKSALRIGVGA